MAIKFYVNGHLVNIQSNAAFLSTQDESLDSGTLVLEWNEMKNALLPQTKFDIEDTTNNETWNFIIKKDDVECVKKGSTTVWQHNLTVEQNTSSLTKKVMRDSIFSQPVQDKILKIHSHGYILTAYKRDEDDPDDPNGYFLSDQAMHMPIKSYSPDVEDYYHNRILITDREKIRGAKVKIESCTQRFVSIAYAGVDRINFTRNSDQRTYNKHGQLYLIIRMYNAESGGTEINHYSFEVPSQATEVALDDNAFMGEGWYTLEYNDRPYFENLTQDDIRFTRNVGEVVDNVYYPNVLAMINIELTFNTYYYTLWDVLNYLRKQQLKTFCYQNHEDSPFEMPSGEAQQYLSKIVAPEFKFNGCDLYTAIAEVFNYIDAVPTLDKNNVLGWEFLNDVNNLDVRPKTDEKTMLEDTYFVDAVVTNYQNAKQNTKIEYPARNVYRRISTDVFGIPSPENYILQVPHKIDYIDDVFVSQTNSFEVFFKTRIDIEGRATITEVNYSPVYLPHDRISIKDSVYEETLYNSLEIGSENAITPNRNNTIFYARESNFINCGGLRDSFDNVGSQFVALNKAIYLSMKYLFSAFGAWSTFTTPTFADLWKIEYNIEYHGIFDGRSKEEYRENRCKDTALFVAQASSSADLNRMGTNMLGVISKLGNEEKNVQFDMSAYGSRVKKGAIYVDDNGYKWVITNVKTTFSTSSDKVFNECTLSKNYNSIGKFTSINQEKRFYEISEKLTSKGYENITEYIYFSLSEIEPLETSCLEVEGIMAIFSQTLGSSNVYSGAEYSTLVTYDKANAISTDRNEVLLPIHTYGLGDSICFEMGFESPLSAGTKLVGTASTSDPLHSESVLYAGDKGFADKFDIEIYGRQTFFESYDFPLIPTGFKQSASRLVEIPEMHYYKRVNEILHLNYQVAFKPYQKETTDQFGVSRYEAEEIYIGKAFIDNNGIIPNAESLGQLYLYCSDDEEYSIRDRECLGDIAFQSSVSVTYYANKTGYIEVTIPSSPQYDSVSGKSWAIGTRDGKLVIGVNQKYENTKSLKLYFSASGKKLY